MTPEEKALLESTHTLAKENNELLRGLMRRARLSNIVKFSYWVIILLISFGALYFIQPLIDNVRDTLDGTGTSSQLESDTNLIQQYKSLIE